MDPVSWLITGATRLAIGLGILAGDGLNALFHGAARSINGSTSTSRKLTKAQKSNEQRTNVSPDAGKSS